MKIALYKGVSPVSWAIRWITRSQYSHAAFVFDRGAALATLDLMKDKVPLGQLTWFTEGSVVEAWQGGVKNSPSISSLHTPKTQVDLFKFARPLSPLEDRALVRIVAGQIGDPYSYWNVLKFLTRRPGKLDGSWFCSELVFQDCRDIGRELLRNKPAWAVPPDWLQLPTELQFEKTLFTW